MFLVLTQKQKLMDKIKYEKKANLIMKGITVFSIWLDLVLIISSINENIFYDFNLKYYSISLLLVEPLILILYYFLLIF